MSLTATYVSRFAFTEGEFGFHRLTGLNPQLYGKTHERGVSLKKCLFVYRALGTDFGIAFYFKGDWTFQLHLGMTPFYSGRALGEIALLKDFKNPRTFRRWMFAQVSALQMQTRLNKINQIATGHCNECTLYDLYFKRYYLHMLDQDIHRHFGHFKFCGNNLLSRSNFAMSPQRWRDSFLFTLDEKTT